MGPTVPYYGLVIWNPRAGLLYSAGDSSGSTDLARIHHYSFRVQGLRFGAQGFGSMVYSTPSHPRAVACPHATHVGSYSLLTQMLDHGRGDRLVRTAQ